MAVKEELPDGWTLKHLVDVADVARGKFTHRPRNDPRFYGGTIPFVQTSDVVNSPKYLRGHSQTLSELGMTVSRMFPENTVLMVIAGSVGASAITKYSVAFPDSIVGITPRNGYSPEFIHHVLGAHQSLMDGVATESAQANLSLDLISMLQLALPSPETANRIAEILNAVDDAIEATRAVIEQTRKLKTALLQDLLTNGIPRKHSKFKVVRDFGQIPESWDFVPLGKVVEFLDERRVPIKEEDRRCIQGKFPYYGASGVIDWVNDYIFDEALVLLAEDGENINSRNLPVAFAIKGKTWVNNHAHVLRSSARILDSFLIAILCSLDLMRYSSGTAQPKLNRETCESLKIPLPTVEEQGSIMLALSSVDDGIHGNIEAVKRLESLKSALSQGLLTGRIPIGGGCHG